MDEGRQFFWHLIFDLNEIKYKSVKSVSPKWNQMTSQYRKHIVWDVVLVWRKICEIINYPKIGRSITGKLISVRNSY